MNQRTQHSKYANPTLFNKDERAINKKYGKDGEVKFLEILNTIYGNKYIWTMFENNWESVDFYGIPNDNDNDYDLKTGYKADIVIELKSKRTLCDPITQKTKSGVNGNSKCFNGNLHFCNWTKYLDIKKRLKEGRINKAFIVFDYLKKEVTNNLSTYDKKNSGDYYFHEITNNSILESEQSSKKCGYDDWTRGVTYSRGSTQSRYRNVKDDIVNIPTFEMLPIKLFKYHILKVAIKTHSNLYRENLVKNHKL